MTDRSKASEKPMPLNDIDLADMTGGGMAVKGEKISTDYEMREGLSREERQIVLSGGSTMYDGIVAKSEK